MFHTVHWENSILVCKTNIYKSLPNSTLNVAVYALMMVGIEDRNM
jgi:hypothetical protein